MGWFARSVLALLLCAPAWTPALQAPAEKPSEARITLQRSTCFGVCPAYKVSVDRAGNVRFEGEKHVAQTGPKEWKVKPGRVEHLLELFERVRFLDTKLACRRSVTDLPATTITLQSGGREVSLANCWAGAAVEFQLFDDQLDPDLDVHVVLDWLADWIDLALGTAPYVKGEKPR